MRQLLVVPLPPNLVDLLEDLQAGESPREWPEVRAAMEAEVGTLLCAHPAQDQPRSSAEDALVALEQAVSMGDIEEATRGAFRFYSAVRQHAVLQARLRQSSIAEFNELQLACHAILRGQVVPLSVADARRRWQILRNVFEARREELPDPVEGALSLGFETTESALNMLERWGGDAQQLKIILANLRSGARALEFLSDWEARLEDSEVVRELLLELESRGCLGSASLQAWPQVWRRLCESWDESELLMPVEAKARLQGLIEQQLESLESLPDWPPERQYTGLDRLQRLADEVADCSFDLEELSEAPVPWLADFVLAYHAGGIPGYVVRQAVAGWKGTDLEELGGLLEAPDGHLRALALIRERPFSGSTACWPYES